LARALLPELDRINAACPGTVKNRAGSVSILVRDVDKPPPKPKLVARDGKFEVVQEVVRPDPNGTQFAICFKDAPELDAGHLVVGRVIGGFDTLQKMGAVKVVQENTSSPYFK
jgi:peptidyl-prolyl cis-trans isomerase B (cyclophilin B)